MKLIANFHKKNLSAEFSLSEGPNLLNEEQMDEAKRRFALALAFVWQVDKDEIDVLTEAEFLGSWKSF